MSAKTIQIFCSICTEPVIKAGIAKIIVHKLKNVGIPKNNFFFIHSKVPFYY